MKSGIKEMKNFSVGELYNKYGIFILLVAVVIIGAIISDSFMSVSNLTNVIKQITVVAILALGAVFVIITNNIDVAQGSCMALVGCATCMVNVATQNLALSIAFSILFGGVIGCTVGFVITRFHVPAFIATLAATEIARGAALLITSGKTIQGMTDNFSYVGQGYIGRIPVSTVLLLVLIVLAYLLLHKSVFGRHVFAVGGNPNAARASGINPEAVIVKSYIIEGILVGIASFVFVSRMNSGPPASGVGYEFDSITACVVGGASLSGGSGSIIGTIIGALIVGVINNLQNLMNVNSYWQQVVRGAVILLAVIIDVMSKRSASKSK